MMTQGNEELEEKNEFEMTKKLEPFTRAHYTQQTMGTEDKSSSYVD